MKTLKVDGSTVPVKENKFLSLRWVDGLKALIVAILAPVADFALGVLTNYINNGGMFEFDWKRILSIALAAGIAYLLKNFLSPSNVVIEKKNL